MSAGPHRIRQREVARGIRAFQQATNIDAENVCVDFHPDGSYSISAKSPDPVIHARDASVVALERIEALKTGLAGATGDQR
jgi:hypothetical protein